MNRPRELGIVATTVFEIVFGAGYVNNYVDVGF